MRITRERVFPICYMIVAVSFFGFVLENLWLLVTRGVMDNRNMRVPFLLGYGLGVAALYLVFGTPRNIRVMRGGALPLGVAYLMYFLFSTVAVTASELVLGLSVERLLGFVYWDYTRIPLNITKYSSLPTSIGFGILITFFMDRCFEPMIARFSRMEGRRSLVVSLVLLTLLTADMLWGYYTMYRLGGLNILWQIRTPWA